MRNQNLLLSISISLLTFNSSALAGMPQGIPLGKVYSAADRVTRSLASELYTPWNTPSTKFQCAGYGMGAGYHAPLVFGRACAWQAEHQGVNWLPASPAPCSHGCDDWSRPSAYNAGYALSSEPVGQQFYAQPGYYPGPTLAAPVPQNTAFSPSKISRPPSRMQTPPSPLRPTEPISPSDANEPEALPMPSI